MRALVRLKRQKEKQFPILVVEQNADQWLLIRSALAQCFPEAQPIWINHATQTLTYLKSCSADQQQKVPRLILLDLFLPHQEDSWALVEAIKAHPVHRQIPVVMLSHSRNPDDIDQSYGCGIASYIIKPTTYHDWLACFYGFRRYWMEIVTWPGVKTNAPIYENQLR